MGCASSKKPSSSSTSSALTIVGATVTPAIRQIPPPQEPISDKKLTKNLLQSPGDKGTAPTITSPADTTVRSQAPVALLLEKTPAQLRAEFEENMREDSSIRLEAPAKYPKRKNSMDLQLEQEQARKAVLRVPSIEKEPQLPLIKDVTSAKSNFDRDKYRKANEGTLPPFSNLPISVQERLDDIQMFGVVDDRTASKPLSSLALLGQAKPAAGREARSMEGYVTRQIGKET